MSTEPWHTSKLEAGMLEKWLLFAIEVSINKSLELNPDLQASFRAGAGKVVAIKARDPFYSFYMIFRGDNIRLVNHYSGKVDARLRVQSKDLVWFFIGPQLLKSGYVPTFQAVGDEPLIQLMRNFAEHWDFWRICRGILKEWLPEFESIEAVFEGLRKKDPAWLAQLEAMPELVERLVEELKHQSGIQQKQLTTLLVLEKNMRRQQWHLLMLTAVIMGLLVFLWMH